MKIRFEYGDGIVREGTYEELSLRGRNGEKVWNRAALIQYVEPQRPTRILCCCREDAQEVKMHIVEKPVGSRRYYLATNPNSSGLHAPTCPKHALDEPDRRKLVNTLSAVQFRTNSDGETIVEVSINPFAGGIREQDGEQKDYSGSDVEQTNPVRTIYKKAEGEETSRTRRATAKFGGLIREWYLLGREYALANRKEGQQYIGKRNIIYGMWQMMLADRVFLANGKSIKTIAFIPHSAITWHREGDQRIIVGLFEKIETKASGEKQLTIRGINVSWSVSVPQNLAAQVNTKVRYQLIGVRVRRHDNEWRLTHLPFMVLLANPNAMWVESDAEREAYLILTRTKFHVKKPIRVMEELGGLRPDFVLDGLDRPVIVEVYGRIGDPDYDEHKEHKRDLYYTYQQQKLIYYVEWDLSKGVDKGKTHFMQQLRELEALL
ncbi:MAG: hypothetical protein K6T83_00105 [Alicyclobacillus sp.]|nr:hypothetical protein [Alicyclobacillus sp.]